MINRIIELAHDISYSKVGKQVMWNEIISPTTVMHKVRQENLKVETSVTLNTYTTVFNKFKENKIDKVNKYYMNENLIETNNNCLTNNIEISKFQTHFYFKYFFNPRIVFRL